MFSFVIILALSSTAIEMLIAAKFPIWRRYAHKYKLINLTLSLGLSFVLGELFGAGGLIAMTAAIVSTILSIPGYAILNYAYDSPKAAQHNGNLFAYKWAKWKQAFIDFGNLIYKIIKIITAPIWITRNLVNKYRELTSKTTHS